jgi:hypothetical protein
MFQSIEKKFTREFNRLAQKQKLKVNFCWSDHFREHKLPFFLPIKKDIKPAHVILVPDQVEGKLRRESRGLVGGRDKLS